MKDLEQRRRCSADSQALSGGLTSPDISPLCSRNLSPRAIERARQWRRDRQRRRWRLRHVRQRHRRKKRRRHRQKRLPRAPVGLGHEEPLPAPPHPHSLSRLGAFLASASPSTHRQKQLPRRLYPLCLSTPASNGSLLLFFPLYLFQYQEGRAHQSCSSHLQRSTHILHCKLAQVKTNPCSHEEREFCLRTCEQLAGNHSGRFGVHCMFFLSNSTGPAPDGFSKSSSLPQRLIHTIA